MALYHVGLDGAVCAPVGCEAGYANKLLGCATSKPTDPSDTHVMHGTDRQEWAVFGAFGGWAAAPAGADVAREEVVTEAVCVG